MALPGAEAQGGKRCPEVQVIFEEPLRGCGKLGGGDFGHSKQYVLNLDFAFTQH